MSDETEVTATVTPVTLPEKFSIPAAAALARDLAIGMYDRETILKNNELTEEQCVLLEKHPYFIRLLEQAAAEWNAPRSVTERLALEAAIGLEKAMPDIIGRMQKPQEPLSGVVEAGKLIAKIAGAGEQKQVQGAPSEKFTITINLGADKEVFEKSRPIVIEEAPAPMEVRPFPGGESDPVPVQSLPEGFGALLSLHTEPDPKGGGT